MKELRGNVVVLDFLKPYCCINCMHVLPTLEYIEKKYKEEPLVVIGVHSGKFDAERDADNIREAIGRYDIKHPVAVDSSMRIWNEYNVRSWPTLVLIRPDGTVAAVAPGEPDPSQLDSFIASQLEQACAQGTLAKGPPDLSVPAIASDNCLSYPGKVKVISHRTIVISDSGHNRLLIANVDGHVKETIGCSKRGFVDGSFEKACFNDPQGVCEYEDKLYVADTKNHAIREIDLEKRTVKTVAGTGELGGMSAGHNIAKEVALRSPWDLCSLGEHIYVAMAGSHQIWRFSPHQGTIEVFAGTGAESIDDGDVRLSSFSQPSGLAHSRGKLYVADSETSAIREIDLEKGIVRTVIGTGLFDFGDRDGEFDTAKLQHCLGLDVCDNGLLIADTYNGKIKLLSFDPPLVKTLHEGLSQPGSVSVEEDGSYFVADTNAHRVVHLWDGKEVEGISHLFGTDSKLRTRPKSKMSSVPLRSSRQTGSTRIFAPGPTSLSATVNASWCSNSGHRGKRVFLRARLSAVR
ncbi:MAG: thioredoxin-like domain-containing protein [Planctomycetota bacterium]|nr:thioredoxin-like domain-containing protein [Planctomycetota bacterium]